MKYASFLLVWIISLFCVWAGIHALFTFESEPTKAADAEVTAKIDNEPVEQDCIHYEVEIVQPEPVVIQLTRPEPQAVSLGEFTLTAYCPCELCCGEYAKNRPIDEAGSPIVFTASGSRAVQGVTVAVDPAVIPYGTELEINGNRYVAQDCGGNIKDKRIDVYFDNHTDAWNFGTQYAEVFLCR